MEHCHKTTTIFLFPGENVPFGLEFQTILAAGATPLQQNHLLPNISSISDNVSSMPHNVSSMSHNESSIAHNVSSRTHAFLSCRGLFLETSSGFSKHFSSLPAKLPNTGNSNIIISETYSGISSRFSKHLPTLPTLRQRDHFTQFQPVCTAT